MDALSHFPKGADKLKTEAGTTVLVKTDVFKQLMYYCYEKDRGRGKFYPLKVEKVKEILSMNRNGEMPLDLNIMAMNFEEAEPVGVEENLTGVIDLPPEKRRKKSSRSRKNRNKKSGDRRPNQKNKSGSPKSERNTKSEGGKPKKRNKNRGRGGNKPNNNTNNN